MTAGMFDMNMVIFCIGVCVTLETMPYMHWSKSALEDGEMLGDRLDVGSDPGPRASRMLKNELTSGYNSFFRDPCSNIQHSDCLCGFGLGRCLGHFGPVDIPHD